MPNELPPWIQILAGLDLTAPGFQMGGARAGGNFGGMGMTGQTPSMMGDFSDLSSLLGVMNGSSASQPYGPSSPTSPSLPMGGNDLLRGLLSQILGNRMAV